MKWTSYGIIALVMLLATGVIMVNSAQANEWKGLRIKNDSFVQSKIGVIDLDTLNLTLMNKVTLSPQYSYNVTICNLTTLSFLRFNNQDISTQFVNSCFRTLTNLNRGTLNRNYNIDIPSTGAFLIKFGNGTEETVYTSQYNEGEVLSTFCGDNQTFYYNTSVPTYWEVNNQTATINGSWFETGLTYNTHPECVNFNSYTINATCLTSKCSKIIQLNTLTGNVTTIWQTGDIW